MNIAYTSLDFEISLEENKVTTLVIENKHLYRQMIRELIKQENGDEGSWILSDTGNILEIKKYVHTILNILQLDLNQKSILTKLQAKFVKMANNEIELVSEINSKIQELLFKLEFEYDLDVGHQDFISAQELIKLGNLYFRQDREIDLLNLISYAEIVQDLLKPKLFVITNLKSLVTDEERREILRTLMSKYIHVLCLESEAYEKGMIDKNFENRYTLDNDFCLI